MAVRVRRRVSAQKSDVRAWQADRDFAMDRSIAAGMGIRPHGWWIHESGRPSLADGAGLDAYSHLDQRLASGAGERLRHLARRRLLEATEVAAIQGGDGPAYSWRRMLLAEVR